MKNLYLKIIETFEKNRERFAESGLLSVETIDLYDGQPDEPNNFEFTCPALFVDYDIDWERGGSSRKQGVVNVEVHVLTHPGTGTESFNPSLPEGLQKLEYYELIAELLEGVCTDNIPPLALIGEKPAITDYFCYHVLKFNTTIYRDKRKKYQKLENVKPIIDVVR